MRTDPARRSSRPARCASRTREGTGRPSTSVSTTAPVARSCRRPRRWTSWSPPTYDSADRLVSTTESGVGTPSYDAHGNTTSIWGETRTYDSSDRHLETTKGSTTVTYVRDGEDRLISRTAGSDVERYGHSGPGDTSDFVMDGSGAVTERTLGLPGGVAVTFRSGSQVWSYPNMHGDTVVITDGSGTKQGVTRTYDPFGNTTGQSLVDNSAGAMDFAMLGEHHRPTEHETALAITVEMGARQYDPVLGRFLEVDPIEGGSANDYDYVSGDPVNQLDLAGTFVFPGVKRMRRRLRSSFNRHRPARPRSHTVRRSGCTRWSCRRTSQWHTYRMAQRNHWCRYGCTRPGRRACSSRVTWSLDAGVFAAATRFPKIGAYGTPLLLLIGFGCTFLS